MLCYLFTKAQNTKALTLTLTALKIVIIVVQCEKSYTVLMCACPVELYVSHLAFTTLWNKALLLDPHFVVTSCSLQNHQPYPTQQGTFPQLSLTFI